MGESRTNVRLRQRRTQAVGDDLTPWVRLGAALLLQAARDAQGDGWSRPYGPGSPDEALDWLGCDFAQGLAEVLGLDQTMARWLGRLRARRGVA